MPPRKDTLRSISGRDSAALLAQSIVPPEIALHEQAEARHERSRLVDQLQDIAGLDVASDLELDGRADRGQVEHRVDAQCEDGPNWVQ
jgi:hypothetical protein